jgi:hypothetical protein
VHKRQWGYQYCTQFGFFYTRDPAHYMRTKLATLEWWEDHCRGIYDGLTPNATATNIEYGDIRLQGSNIIFTNGIEDIWKPCSIEELPSESKMKAVMIDCNDCAHCVDFTTPNDATDSQNLKNARKEIMDYISNISVLNKS